MAHQVHVIKLPAPAPHQAGQYVYTDASGNPAKPGRGAWRNISSYLSVNYSGVRYLFAAGGRLVSAGYGAVEE